MARRNGHPWYFDPTPSYCGYDGDADRVDLELPLI
jgi:hypothetical protein